MAFKDFDIDQLETVSVQKFRSKEKQNSEAQEILMGLQADQKYISSKFFYDKRGSELFEEITKLNEYYPTRTEKAILKNVAPQLFGNLKNVKIIELGSGDCSKISILLDSINSEHLETITYVPVDVSESALEKSAFNLSDKFPAIRIEGVVADFLNQYEYLESESQKIICFLGSTIGNLSKVQANDFIRNISAQMQKGDLFLLGADMVKNVEVVEAAYNDSINVTANFNKNILNSVNRKLGAQINLENFEHKAFYNRKEDRIEMHLVCLKSHSCTINGKDQSIHFTQGETIHTENSHKYTSERLHEFATNNGLHLRNIFSDSNNYFSVCLFEK